MSCFSLYFIGSQLVKHQAMKITEHHITMLLHICDQFDLVANNPQCLTTYIHAP
jgi:hypothetical protein